MTKINQKTILCTKYWHQDAVYFLQILIHKNPQRQLRSGNNLTGTFVKWGILKQALFTSKFINQTIGIDDAGGKTKHFSQQSSIKD